MSKKYVTDFPQLLEEWNYSKNKDLSPSEVFSSSQKKVWWVCKKGHEYECSPGNKTQMHVGCPICSSRRLLKGYNDLETKYPLLAKEFDVEKNNKLPSEVIAGSNKKYWWKCSNGHSYEAEMNRRIDRGNGCPYCSGHRVLKGFNDLMTTHPQIALEWDYEKNSISPDKISKGSLFNAYWICPHGHSYKAKVNQRDNKNNCPYCNHQKVLRGFNDLETTNPLLAKEWHPTKNGNTRACDVSEKSGKKYWWVCSHGHEWQQSPHLRSRGRGCPICSNEIHVSFPEKVFYFYIKKVFPNALENFNPGWKNQRNIDIYIPNLKLGIEYDGDRWHRSLESDLIKNGLCQTHGIKLIRIREPKCPIIQNSSSIDYLFDKSDYQKAIDFILSYISSNYKETPHIKIDLSKDITSINELVISSEKKNSIVITNPDVLQDWNYAKNGLLKPEFLTKGSDKKVWWKCHKCGYEWIAPINNRCRLNRGCPNCNSTLFKKGENDLKTKSPELLNWWDFQRNEILPDEILFSSRKKVWWKCSLGHSFQKNPFEMYNKIECPYCSNNKLLKGFNDLRTKCPELIKIWDFSKNLSDPSDYIFNSNKKVWWVCENGHTHLQRINYKAKVNRCPICSGKQIFKGVNDLQTIFPDIASEFDLNKNKPVKPDEIGTKVTTKYWWKCPICDNSYEARVNWRTSGHGCPKCSKKNK